MRLPNAALEPVNYAPVRTLLVATTNRGKAREIERSLAGVSYELQTLADRPGLTEPEETGQTFADVESTRGVA